MYYSFYSKEKNYKKLKNLIVAVQKPNGDTYTSSLYESWCLHRQENLREVIKEDVYSYSSSVVIEFKDIGVSVPIKKLLVDLPNNQPYNNESAAEMIGAVMEEARIDEGLDLDAKVNLSDELCCDDELKRAIEENIQINILDSEFYNNLMPSNVSPLFLKYILFPIQLVSKLEDAKIETVVGYINVVLYRYIDGRCILKFSHDFDEKDIDLGYSVNKNISKAYVSEVVLLKKGYRVKNIEKKMYTDMNDFLLDKFGENTINNAVVTYVNKIIELIGANPIVSEHQEQIHIRTINGENSMFAHKNTEFQKLIFGLSHAPIPLDRLESIAKKELNDNCINLLGILGVALNKFKIVGWYEGEYIDKVLAEGNSAEIKPDVYYYSSLHANLWPMLEQSILKSIRMKVELFIHMDGIPTERQVEKALHKSYMGKRLENSILFSSMDTVEKYTEIFEDKIIPTYRKKRMTELVEQQTQMNEFSNNRTRNQASFFLGIVGFMLTIVLSYDAIDMMAKTYFKEPYTTQLYIYFLIFLIFIILLIWIMHKQSRIRLIINQFRSFFIKIKLVVRNKRK
ncbi:hypothetical protein [Listeria booriae]|uniref:hypothetical protein n=1 Tax=Listeria booriae TaxID=1552123 RepID=UPI00163DBF21|nr:hypothetical protein [Listeria booriae]MBC1308851.1 hypothetical protein [Listeria booriae]